MQNTLSKVLAQYVRVSSSMALTVSRCTEVACHALAMFQVFCVLEKNKIFQFLHNLEITNRFLSYTTNIVSLKQKNLD